MLIELNYSQAPQGVKHVIPVFAVLGFERSIQIFSADSQGFHRFMVTDLEHEDMVEMAISGPENNLIVTGSQDALIQVRGRCMSHHPHLHLRNRKYDSLGIFWLQNTETCKNECGQNRAGHWARYGGVSWDPETDLRGITKIFNEGYSIPTTLEILGRFWPSEWSRDM